MTTRTSTINARRSMNCHLTHLLQNHAAQRQNGLNAEEQHLVIFLRQRGKLPVTHNAIRCHGCTRSVWRRQWTCGSRYDWLALTSAARRRRRRRCRGSGGTDARSWWLRRATAGVRLQTDDTHSRCQCVIDSRISHELPTHMYVHMYIHVCTCARKMM